MDDDAGVAEIKIKITNKSKMAATPTGRAGVRARATGTSWHREISLEDLFGKTECRTRTRFLFEYHEREGEGEGRGGG